MSIVFKEEIRRIREKARKNRSEREFKVISWLEQAPLQGTGAVTALTFILPTRGCKFAEAKHGGCSMCGYPNENPLEPTEEQLRTLPDTIMEHFEKKKVDAPMIVKFFTSGSFLDKLEIPVDIREEILRRMNQEENVKEIIVESRAEYVIKKNLESMAKVINPEKIVIAIGLESADDAINKRSINKGMTWKQFTRAVTLARSYGFKIKAYVLLKPLFLSEAQAVQDALWTAEQAIKAGAELISINSANIQKGTLMEEVFYQKAYRPPWIWSAYYVSKIIKEKHPEVRVICDVVAAGTPRGPRNCGKCDADFKKALQKFSATQDLKVLNELDCSCKIAYQGYMMQDILGSGNGFVHTNPFPF